MLLVSSQYSRRNVLISALNLPRLLLSRCGVNVEGTIGAGVNIICLYKLQKDLNLCLLHS